MAVATEPKKVASKDASKARILTLKNKWSEADLLGTIVWPGYVQQYDTSRSPIPPVEIRKKGCI